MQCDKKKHDATDAIIMYDHCIPSTKEPTVRQDKATRGTKDLLVECLKLLALAVPVCTQG